MDNLHQHGEPSRTTPRNRAHSPTSDPQTPENDTFTGLTISHSLSQRLQEARERRASGQANTPRSQPEPERGADDYIFEDDTPRRRRRPQVSRITSAPHSGSPNVHSNGNSARRPSQGLGLGSKEVQERMDKLGKANFGLKLRVCLAEEKNAKLRDEIEKGNADDKAQCDKLEQELAEAWAANEELSDQLKQRQEIDRANADEFEKAKADNKAQCDKLKQKVDEAWAVNDDLMNDILTERNTSKEAHIEGKARCDQLERELAETRAVNEELVDDLKRRDAEIQCLLEEKNQLEEELAETRGVNEELVGDLNERDAEMQSLLEEKNQVEEQLDETWAAHEELVDELKQRNAEMQSLLKEKNQLEEELAETRAVNEKLVGELKASNIERQKACDDRYETEQKYQLIAQQLKSCHETPYSEKDSAHEKDSAYYGSDAQSITSPEQVPSQLTSASTVESSPSQRTRSQASLPHDHFKRLADSLSVKKSRASELETRASFHTLASSAALQDVIRSDGPATTTTHRTLSRNFGSGTIHGPQTHASADSTPSRTRGLRTLFLAHEHVGSTTSVETAQNQYGDASEVAQSHEARPASSTPSEVESLPDAPSGPDTPVFSDDENLGSLTDGASDARPASVLTMSNLSVHDARSDDKLHSPTTLSDVSQIPREYQPGQYPRWPGMGRHLGQDMFFDAEGLDDIPTRRAWY
ncbi:hypothetical protein K490DRAFT_63517 [Saccharata proteae CBS 121410]|uniref:Centrosomin N-terminal motif 1 domain-containing protein n=1 Tax=Saccharata proteae CBS 121410 TaxID=1314787 RepID=A0A6A5YF08_9PEZI|nr:hypothetical protein K490DRAFT_63517 [Saccharata proteae CBS 121410]